MSFLNMGTVYGTLLNFQAEMAAWAPKMGELPYKSPPKAPVLYVKPSNTWSTDGAPIVLPARFEHLEVGASVAMVMRGPGDLAGYVLMTDFSLPHDSYYRPPVKFKCMDGTLAVGGQLLAAAADVDPATFKVEVRVNGELRQTVDFSQLVRPAAQLLADVGEFMTLGTGDVLLLGCDILPGGGRPLATRGDTVELKAEGMGTLTSHLIREITLEDFK